MIPFKKGPMESDNNALNDTIIDQYKSHLGAENL